MATSTHIRESSATRLLRTQTPYANWFDGSFPVSLHAHPTPRDSLTSPPEPPRKPTWLTSKIMGSRHVLDIAGFSLWDEEAHGYVNPTREQVAWIMKTYKAGTIEFFPPFLVIATDSPSLSGDNGQISLTVGCAPVIFTSLETLQAGFHAGVPRANSLQYIDTRSNDLPAGSYQAIPWIAPTSEQAQEVFTALQPSCNIHALNFIWPHLIVELANDHRVYTQGSLPSKVAGWAISYHQDSGNQPYWQSPMLHARQREMNPTRSAKGDMTNYMQVGNGVIGPGVRVEGRTKASSAGLCIRKGNKVRITLAAHSFEDGTKVFHPAGDHGDPIAVLALQPASVYFGLTPTGGAPELRDGICGAPIIHETRGEVAGFFQSMNPAGWCFAPQLDTLIDEGWDLF